MIAQKLKQRLSERGIDAETSEANPITLEGVLRLDKFDLIAHVSPVRQDCGIPKVNAIGLLTGLGEEQVIEDCLRIIGEAAGFHK
jgi:PTS system galactitol-specific IIB component